MVPAQGSINYTHRVASVRMMKWVISTGLAFVFALRSSVQSPSLNSRTCAVVEKK